MFITPSPRWLMHKCRLATSAHGRRSNFPVTLSPYAERKKSFIAREGQSQAINQSPSELCVGREKVLG